ncbi:MAG: helix-turn-helix domain-containing protein [Pseudomonadota bacterium]|nr:helix-turn-helix domain-containing protein [Pseudomonadota bacterium]
MNELGKYLRGVRGNRGQSLRKMAEELQVTPAILSAVETGKKDISESLIGRIAEYLKLSGNDLLRFEVMAQASNESLKVDLRGKSKEEAETFALLARRVGDLKPEVLSQLRDLIEPESEDVS